MATTLFWGKNESYIPCLPDKTHHISKFGGNRRDAMSNPLWWLCRETLNHLISNTDWSFLNDNDLETACENFTSCLMSLIKECILHNEVIIRPDDKPWYDSVIRSYSCKRDRTKSKASKSGRTEDWRAYRKLRNQVNNLKNTQKKKIYNTLENTIIKTSSSNSKMYWKLIKYLG